MYANRAETGLLGLPITNGYFNLNLSYVKYHKAYSEFQILKVLSNGTGGGSVSGINR